MQIRSQFGKGKAPVLLVVIFILTLVTACSTGGASKVETSTADAAAAAEAATGSTSALAAEEETISVAELKASFDQAAIKEGKVQIADLSVDGDEIKPKDTDAKNRLAASFRDLGGNDHKWNEITGVRATSTLRIKGYDYSAWNMFDWDKKTIWAEANGNEGIYEGFELFMDRPTRIEGFRIYPGFQENKKLYRNNYLPCQILVQAGDEVYGYDLRRNIRDLKNDSDFYAIDCYFDEPVYSDYMSVMIRDITSYGSDPDTDCCISEFHPFYY